MKKSKYLGKLLFSFIAFIMLTLNVNAASATVGVSTSASQVVVGNTVKVTVTISSASALGSWEYSLYYDTSLFSLSSSTVDLHYAGYASNASTKSVSYSYTFKAKKSGTGKFYVNQTDVVGWDENRMTVTNGSRSVKVITQQQLQASYSKNNYLKNLEIEGFELNPAFDKNTLEYSVTLPPETEKIKINATKEDSKASISGAGEKEVSLGLNKFEIIVTAQNGSEKKYTLNVTVQELEPIEVAIGNSKFTVVRQAEMLEVPVTYELSTVFIDGEEVPALYNENLNITLVGLKDANGKIALYTYNEKDSSYTLYQELKFGSISIVPKEYNKKLSGYEEVEIEINGIKVKAFAKEGNKEFYIIYGMNTVSGNTQLYKYDKVENTIQRYEDGLVNDELTKNYVIVMALFGAGLVLSMLIVLGLLTSKSGNNYSGKEIKNIFNDNGWNDKPLSKKEKKLKAKQDKIEAKEKEKLAREEEKRLKDEEKNAKKKIKELKKQMIKDKETSKENDDEMYMLFDKNKK